MPPPRTQRVPDQYARTVLERLNRSGELPVILALLWDHHDALRQRLDAMLATEVLADPKQLAKFQAAQGALEEVNRIARIFEALGARESLPEAANDADGLFVRPSNPRTRSRPNKRLTGHF